MSTISVKLGLFSLAAAGIALLLSTSSLYAQEAAAEAVEEDEIEEEAEKRDPFWPVGYVSTAEKKRISEEEARAAEEEAKRKEEEAKRLERRRQQMEAAKNAKVQPPVVEDLPEPDWGAAVNKLKISGYAEKNGVRSCLIAGQPVSEGTNVAFVYNGFRYIWTVKVIGPRKKDMRFVRVSAEPVK